MRVRHAGEGGEPHSDCSFRRHRRVFTPSTPLAVGGLRVRLVCEGGKPNQTAHSVATDAPHRLHTSCTPRRLHTSCVPHRLHTVDSTVRRRPARAPRLLRDPPSSHSRLHCPSASCACAAPLACPTVFTLSTPLTVDVLRVRRACSLMQVSWPRPVCTCTKTPHSPPCPFASLTHGIVVRMSSKSFSADRKNSHLQNLSHRSCTLSGCCPPTPLRSSVFLAGRVHRPARQLTLHRP